MKGYAMLKIGESGWIEKERPKCGPMDASAGAKPEKIPERIVVFAARLDYNKEG